MIKFFFFFSLKCGLLYDEFIEGDRLKEIKSFYDTILRMSLDEAQPVENKKAIASILESVRSKKGIKKEDVARVFSCICLYSNKKRVCHEFMIHSFLLVCSA